MLFFIPVPAQCSLTFLCSLSIHYFTGILQMIGQGSFIVPVTAADRACVHFSCSDYKNFHLVFLLTPRVHLFEFVIF